LIPDHRDQHATLAEGIFQVLSEVDSQWNRVHVFENYIPGKTLQKSLVNPSRNVGAIIPAIGNKHASAPVTLYRWKTRRLWLLRWRLANTRRFATLVFEGFKKKKSDSRYDYYANAPCDPCDIGLALFRRVRRLPKRDR